MASGFISSLTLLADAEIRFVLVGVTGINFYARDAAHAFATLDVGVLLDTTVSNLRDALKTLRSADFRFEAGGEPFLDDGDDQALSNIIRSGASISARHDEEGQIDLMLSMTGASYQELESDARTFDIDGRSVLVGRLERLLRSKELSGRPKDKEFLRAFAAQMEETDKGE